eukprot:8293583-Lingulodinium_polyedra.AAC.1
MTKSAAAAAELSLAATRSRSTGARLPSTGRSSAPAGRARREAAARGPRWLPRALALSPPLP